MTVKCKLKWVKQTGRHSHGEDLYLGPWKVGSVCWSMTSRSGPNYEVHCSLPGRPAIPGDDNQDLAKGRLASAVTHWLSKIDEVKE